MSRLKQAFLVLGLLIVLLLSGCAQPGASSVPAELPPTIEPSPTAPAPDYSGLLQISELMVRNKAALALDGFADWVELKNISGETLDLTGWRLTDRVGRDGLPLEGSLADGALLLVSLGGEGGFGLAYGETLRLCAPDGDVQDNVLCTSEQADLSLQRQADGSFLESPWISPGFPNGKEGYERFCASREEPGPLRINEVMVSNRSYPLHHNDEAYDWVEIKNISGEPVELSGFCLSDEFDTPDKWTFPAQTLAPGALLVVLCDAERVQEAWLPTELNTGFSLDSQNEQLYLSRTDGSLVDYAALHDIPLDCSMGREEGRSGFLYYASPSPKADNSGGLRRVSAMPELASPDGVFDNVEEVTAALRSSGEIHYTLDGSVPDVASPLYAGALSLHETGVVRAVAIEEDALPSGVLTASYILNEGHTLPVLSLVVDDLRNFSNSYDWGDKASEYAANLALYDGEHSFNRACGLSMKGWTSLQLPKKSMGVAFRGRYGGDLEADVFGNGITRFHTLSIRAGQDYTFSIFRNELIQELALEGSDVLLTQASKYCILYLNGEYRGIYCLKEDFSRQYYASHRGVSKESVENLRGPVSAQTDLYKNVIEFSWYNDLSVEENYRQICDNMDMDSLIDWFLFESYCSNTDIQGNLRFLRSPENGNKWEMAFYDLDWSFKNTYAFSALLSGAAHSGSQMPPLMMKLCQNPDFRDRVLRRYAELIGGVLSNEHVLAKIDELQALLEPEAARDRARWGLELHYWYSSMEELRSFIRDSNWARLSTEYLCEYLRVSSEERLGYFGF